MKFEAPFGQIRADLVVASRATYGKQYRLEIGVAIAALEAPIWSRNLAKTLDLPENQVASELHFFADRGALLSFPAEHDRRKLYEVVEHPFWSAMRAYFEWVLREAHPDDGDRWIEAYWAAICDGHPQSIPEKAG